MAGLQCVWNFRIFLLQFSPVGYITYVLLHLLYGIIYNRLRSPSYGSLVSAEWFDDTWLYSICFYLSWCEAI